MADEERQEVRKQVIYETVDGSSGRNNAPVIVGVLLVVAVLIYFIVFRWS